MKTNPSRDQLSKSLDRRVRHLMIRTLERFESAFPDKDDTREGQIFKGDIRTMFNDALRAQRDELNDYELEYRPLRMTADNTLTMTSTFLQTVRSIFMEICENTPCIRIYASPDHAKVLEAVRAEFGTGVIHRTTAYDEECVALEIVGVQSCVDSVLPIMDRYCLHADVRAKYQQWRREVVRLYKEQGNGRA